MNGKLWPHPATPENVRTLQGGDSNFSPPNEKSLRKTAAAFHSKWIPNQRWHGPAEFAFNCWRCPATLVASTKASPARTKDNVEFIIRPVYANAPEAELLCRIPTVMARPPRLDGTVRRTGGNVGLAPGERCALHANGCALTQATRAEQIRNSRIRKFL